MIAEIVIALVLLAGVGLAIWFSVRASRGVAAIVAAKDQDIEAKHDAAKAALLKPTPEEQVAKMTPEEKTNALNSPD